MGKGIIYVGMIVSSTPFSRVEATTSDSLSQTQRTDRKLSVLLRKLLRQPSRFTITLLSLGPLEGWNRG